MIKIKHLMPTALMVFFLSCQTTVKMHTDRQSNTQPNVIVILADDLGYADVGFNGCQDIPTPNIDRIADEGVKFTNAYVTYAVCAPSRAGLLTGRYQDRFGFGDNTLFAPNDSNQGLPLSEQTLATALDDVGYQTMAVGKWHLGAHESLRPLNRGFDEFFGFLSGGHRYFPEELDLADISEVKSQYGAYRTKLLKNDQRVEESEYLTDAFSREAVSFIERNAKNPFFIYLAYNAPHSPLQATEKYLNRFDKIEDTKRKTYAAMVSAVDDGVGHLLAKLEELNIADNTMVIFLSDNGGPESKNASDNGILRDGKGSLYEGGIHVPFAIKWSQKILAGTVYENPVMSFDIFATVVQNIGAEPRNPLDGVNLLPYVKGENNGNPHDFLAWRKFDQQENAVQSKKMKLVKIKGQDELYNLANDIGEQYILNNGAITTELTELKNQWISEMIDPVFLGLLQNEEYNKSHPDRFVVEKY